MVAQRRQSLDGNAFFELARLVGERIGILCVASQWSGPPRTAAALSRRGAAVCIVAPPDSFAALTRFKAADILLPREAIPRALPGILHTLADGFGAHAVLAGDTAAFFLLADLVGRQDEIALSGPARALLARSMPRAGAAHVLTRASALVMCERDGVLAPPLSTESPTSDEALRFARAIGYPVLVKHNGFVAGEGVTRCDDEASLLVALSRPSLNPTDPDFVVQRFIDGAVYGVALSGFEGRAAAAFAFEKLVTHPAPFGPASVLRFEARADIIADARRLYEAYGMNGYAGIDYIVDAAGRAHLLEINPCIVPKSHFGDVFGVDLTAAMLAMLRGAPLPEAKLPTHGFVAMFPGEWRRDAESVYLHSAFHDAPWDDPAVLHAMADSALARTPAPPHWRAALQRLQTHSVAPPLAASHDASHPSTGEGAHARLADVYSEVGDSDRAGGLFVGQTPR